jgi:hypothetical protein
VPVPHLLPTVRILAAVVGSAPREVCPPPPRSRPYPRQLLLPQPRQA